MEGSGPIATLCGLWDGLFSSKPRLQSEESAPVILASRSTPESRANQAYLKDSTERKDDYTYARAKYAEIVTAGKTFSVEPIDARDIAVAKHMTDSKNELDVANSIHAKLADMFKKIEQSTQADNLTRNQKTITVILQEGHWDYWRQIHFHISKIQEVFLNPTHGERIAARIKILNEHPDTKNCIQKCCELFVAYLLHGWEMALVPKDKDLIGTNGRALSAYLIKKFEPLTANSRIVQTAVLAFFEEVKEVHPNHLKLKFPPGSLFECNDLWVNLRSEEIKQFNCKATIASPKVPLDLKKVSSFGVAKSDRNWNEKNYRRILEAPPVLTNVLPPTAPVSVPSSGYISFLPPVLLPIDLKDNQLIVSQEEDNVKIIEAYLHALEEAQQGIIQTSPEHVMFIPPVALPKKDSEGKYFFTNEDDYPAIIQAYFEALLNKAKETKI